MLGNQKCGRESGGPNEKEFGTCPASINKKANDINGGLNGGRACWAIAGTMCNGEIQGTFAKKYKTCVECEHYQQVIKEEGDSFKDAADILWHLNK